MMVPPSLRGNAVREVIQSDALGIAIFAGAIAHVELYQLVAVFPSLDPAATWSGNSE